MSTYTYRGWTISQGRWPEPAWSATGPGYDAWTEGEGEWRDNGEKADGVTREHLIEEIDAWFEEHVAKCRGCGCELRGSPYYTGKPAYLPDGSRAPACHYGGWVCSRSCDVRACLELEQSMPGHGWEQTRVGSYAQERINSNWDHR